MSKRNRSEPRSIKAGTRYFYVDEAGDLTLVGRRGQSLFSSSGVSRCFLVGAAHVADPEQLKTELDILRADLLNDPYFRNIPSMQSKARKTALLFHAKDDCAEVRREVFKLLVRHDIKVIVGVRRKETLLAELRFARSERIPFNPNSVYDSIVKAIFKRLLHVADSNRIYFARRGKSTRQIALESAIKRAQFNFKRDTGIESDKPTEVIPTVPSEEGGLQAIDYFLWALQRLYERGEDRYFEYVSDHFSLIMDFDDERNGKDYGRWYSKRDKLTKEKMLPITG